MLVNTPPTAIAHARAAAALEEGDPRHLRQAAERLFAIAKDYSVDSDTRSTARFTAKLCLKEAERLEKEEECLARSLDRK